MRLLLLLAAFSSAYVAPAQSKETGTTPSATSRPNPRTWSERHGDRVVIKKHGPTFRIPEEWVKWHDRFGNNLHVQPIMLGPTAEGDFDREFAEVVDGLFDLPDCGFHGGGEGWGKHSVSYGDVQMRVYVLEDDVPTLEQRLDGRGAEVVRGLFTEDRVAERNLAGAWGRQRAKAAKPRAEKSEQKLPPVEQFKPTRSADGEWQLNRWRFALHFGDYGATAYVEVRLRRFAARTVALVFMHTDFRDHDKTKRAIIDSVIWKNPPTSTGTRDRSPRAKKRSD